MPLFIKSILSDLKVELLDEFDKNFERKAFFDKPWKGVMIPNHRGSLMIRTGGLRKSIRGSVMQSSVTFLSSHPQAKILNEGGFILVTAKMKKFFWAMYYHNVGGVKYNIKTKSAVYNDKTRRLTQEAKYWKALALKKVGSRIKIEARPYIGHHRMVDHSVRVVIDARFQELNHTILKALKP
jgi:hypothetical protein